MRKQKNLLVIEANQNNIYLAGRNLKYCLVKNIAESMRSISSRTTRLFSGNQNMLKHVEKAVA